MPVGRLGGSRVCSQSTFTWRVFWPSIGASEYLECSAKSEDKESIADIFDAIVLTLMDTVIASDEAKTAKAEAPQPIRGHGVPNGAI